MLKSLCRICGNKLKNPKISGNPATKVKNIEKCCERGSIWKLKKMIHWFTSFTSVTRVI